MILVALLAVERIATGYGFTEGVVATPKGVFFTDVPRGEVYRWAGRGEPQRVGRFQCVGLEVTPNGDLVGVQSRRGRLVSVLPGGKPVAIARNLNDLVADRFGGLYVTAPDFRRPANDAVYYLPKRGPARRLPVRVANPNGVALSPDGGWLYLVAYRSHDVWRFRVSKPGVLAGGARLVKLAGPGGRQANTGGDGIAVGRDGRLYIAVPEAKGIHVAEADGRFVRFLAVPEKPSNCAVSVDGRTLFVTAQRSLYRVSL